MKISLAFVLGICLVVGGYILERDDFPLEDEGHMDETDNEEKRKKLPLPAMLNEGAYQGDMLLDDDQWEIVRALENNVQLGKRKAHSDLSRRWPNAEIPYYVDADVEDRYGTDIADAVTYYEQNTCLDFTKHTSVPSGGYIHVKSGTGCSSKVGYLNSKRTLTLKLGSCRSAIPHEFGHAIGFQHEHVRPDRDSYVSVRWNNILSGYSSAFTLDTYISTYDVPYDYKSCMHYEPTAFSVDTTNKATLVTTNPLDMVDMGISDDPNFSDIKLINLMYSCNSSCTATTCNNGGYQDKTCNCVCPEGWTGSDCSTSVTLPDDCKNTITGGSGDITSENYPSNYPKNHVCQWYIKGTSAGQTITVTFVDFVLEEPNSSGSCLYDDFVAIRKDDLFFGGDIYCGTSSPGTQTVTSTSSIPEMLIYFEVDGNSDVQKGFKFTYSIS
ncbi:Blastula protease 10 [Holothuria leucospilota]|uniref:Metalloendopeptidase n=1 Tax=Holothuria leucospilota TaxID=206669 RepID=A0A9Q1CI47_HOLLE|nr:Blastula protease 10 [Holothuria leucospilota]